MTVRLKVQWAGQAANTLYTGPDEGTLISIGKADSDIQNLIPRTIAVASGKDANGNLVYGDESALNDQWATSRGLPWKLYNPSGLRRWRAALDGAHTTPARSITIGDSRPAGVGNDNVNSILDNALCDRLSIAGRRRTLYARDFGTQEAGVITPNFEGSDARVAKSGGTADSSTGPFQLGWRVQTGNTITTTTPSCTTVEIWCFNDTNITGTFSYQIDGGSTVNIAATQADADGNTSGFKRFVVTGLSQATHTVVVTGTSGSNSIQLGVAYHSGVGVLSARIARAGYTILDFFGLGAAFPGNNTAVGNAPALARLTSFYGAFKMDKWDIWVDYNDWQAQISANYTSGLKPTPDVFQAYLNTVVQGIGAAGGCALLLGATNSPGATTPVGGLDLSAYNAAMKAVVSANSNYCACAIESEYWGSAADAVALSLHASPTSIHQSQRGYGSTARGLYGMETGGGIYGI